MHIIDVHASARDIRPAWEPRPYSEGQAKLIKTMCEERGITPAQLLEVFPARPTTFADGSKVISWIKSYVAPTPAPAQEAATVADGYFAIPAGQLGFSKPHFFRLKHGAKTGKWADKQFLTEQASDERYPVRGVRRAEVLAWLAEHSDEARALYGTLISRCSRCNRTLTDHDNPYFPMYGPECGGK